MGNIIITVLSSLISGLLGVVISNRQYKKYEKNKIKMDTFRRVVAYRYCLVPNSQDNNSGEFFSALNEVFVVFNENKEVIDALKKLHEELNLPDRSVDNLVTLIKKMSEVLNVNYSQVNDSFFERPFSRGIASS